MSRIRKEIDQRVFEELCSIQCTQKEICGVLGTTDKTLIRWVKETYADDYIDEDCDEVTWQMVYDDLRSKGKASLRRRQFKLADNNAIMAIWLGKQYLGQKDTHEAEVKATVQIIDDIPKADDENCD